ncbi:MAG: cytochrome c, partial [Rhodothermales bacterium]|nr:cytochrome c [Rhodothermales bacterium]
LTAEQIEHGVGPIDAFDPGPIDTELAARGEAVFTTNCSACHKMDSRYVGPSLGDVTVRRSPAFVMNMILNPDGMIKEHPEGKKMFAEYMTPMANQNMTEDQARAILEYLRTQAPSN